MAQATGALARGAVLPVVAGVLSFLAALCLAIAPDLSLSNILFTSVYKLIMRMCVCARPGGGGS